MASESIAHSALWATDSEPSQARGIIVKYSKCEYKAKQNRCRELGVLPSFRVRTSLKYKNIPGLMILKVRKDLMVFKQRDFIAK